MWDSQRRKNRWVWLIRNEIWRGWRQQRRDEKPSLSLSWKMVRRCGLCPSLSHYLSSRTLCTLSCLQSRTCAGFRSTRFLEPLHHRFLFPKWLCLPSSLFLRVFGVFFYGTVNSYYLHMIIAVHTNRILLYKLFFF